MTDNLISLYTVLALTSTATSTALAIPKAGTPRRGWRVRALVGNVVTVTPTASTLALSIQHTRDGSTTWLTTATVRNPTSLTTDNITAAGEYYSDIIDIQDCSATGATYPAKIRVVATIGGSGPSFDIDAQIVVSRPG